MMDSEHEFEEPMAMFVEFMEPDWEYLAELQHQNEGFASAEEAPQDYSQSLVQQLNLSSTVENVSSEDEYFESESEHLDDSQKSESEEEEANDNEIIKQMKRETALRAVQKILDQQLNIWFQNRNQEDLQTGPTFKFPNYRHRGNVEFDESFGIVRKDTDLRSIKYTTIRYQNPQSKNTYIRILQVLGKIFNLVKDNERMTKRELYYKLLGEIGIYYVHKGCI